MRVIPRLYAIFTISVSIVLSNSFPTLQNIDYVVKENGLVFEFNFSSEVAVNFASGWYSETEWFYITFLNTSIDSTHIPQIEISKYVKDFQIDLIGESIQISLKLSKAPESQEFYKKQDETQVYLSLRSKMPLFTTIRSQQRKEIKIIPTEIEDQEIDIFKSDNTIVTMGYVLGITFTIAGIIQEDTKHTVNWELPLGIVIFSGTYIYDKYFNSINKIPLENLEEDN